MLVYVLKNFFKKAQPLLFCLLGDFKHLLHVLHVTWVTAIQLVQGSLITLLSLRKNIQKNKTHKKVMGQFTGALLKIRISCSDGPMNIHKEQAVPLSSFGHHTGLSKLNAKMD